jgi:transposase
MRGQKDAYTFLRFTAKNCSCIPSGRTIREVAKRFMVTKRTVHRLVQQYKQTQDLTPKKVGTKRVGILEQNKVAILAIVEEYPDTVFSEILGYGRVVHTPMEGIRVVPCNQQKDCKCLWQYVEIIGERLGIHVSISTLHSFLKKHKITLKKRHSAVKKPRVKLCRNNA